MLANSILFMIEAQTRYIMGLIEDMVCDGIGAVEVRPDVMDQFNSKIGALTEKTVWAESCHSWYKNESGKITNNWPGFSDCLLESTSPAKSNRIHPSTRK